MAIVKNNSANLVIQTPRNVNSNITLDTDQVIIVGNLTVLGNTSQIETNNTVINDNIIMLNYGETGAGVTKGTAGIIIDRGSLANVTLQWNELTTTWQITTDGSTFANIFTNPLTSNLNTSSYTITNSTNVVFGANLQLNNSLVAPSSVVTGATVVYAGAPAGGTTGVYVLNGAAANQELVTKTRALGFSLLF